VSRSDLHPENQLNELREFCKLKEFDVYREYVDVASGIKESRPQLDLMMKDAFNGKFKVVIIWKLDRLGRSLQHLVSIINQWKKYNVDFICTTQQFDTTTPNGKLLFHIFGAIAEFERDMISERTKVGLKRAAKKGKFPGRPKGSKDKKPRKKGGYYLRYKN
jgi:DNA invertase Pin-like site-specific DNA recombinase